MSSDTQPLLREEWPETDNRGDAQGLSPDNEKRIDRIRLATKEILVSKFAHYSIITVVALDVTCIFGDIFINLFTCEQKNPDKGWGVARETLGITSLVFSCLFMLELLLSVWAFGFEYFRSWFHSFDAAVITVGFVVDVVLHGVVEEMASLIVILRLWRIFKIIEEFSVGAEKQMEALKTEIKALESENRALKEQLNALRREREEE